MLSLNQLSALSIKLISIITLAILLASCGGSGGGSNNASTATSEEQRSIAQIRNELNDLSPDQLQIVYGLINSSSLDMSVANVNDILSSLSSLSMAELNTILDIIQDEDVIAAAPIDGEETINYSGPPPSSDEAQRYRQSIWQNIALASRCGGCHVQDGSATPIFARTDDINLAYADALSNNLLNQSNPAASRLVTKVAEDHNCWATNVSTCEALMTVWVGQFFNVGGATSFLGALNLQEPTLKTVGNSKQFPALADDGSNVDFESTVYPLLNQYCGSCHSPDASLQQQPYLGGSNSNPNITDTDAIADDINVAYEAARSRMNLVSPNTSRIVARLRDEGHNCWGGSCVTSSSALQSAIETFSNNITPVSVDSALVISRELNLDSDGQAASSGGRVEDNVIAKWNFRDGAGSPATRSADDTSGVSPALTLNLSGNVEWLASGGVRINNGKLQGSSTDSVKLYNRITSSGEYTIEAWVVPLNVTQDGPARIVTYSGASDRRNFMLGQTLYDYDFLARSSTTDADGQPAVSTPMADEVLQATLQHVAATYSATEGRKIYVNGELVTTDPDPEGAGNFNSWDRNFALVLGNEVSNDYQWQGVIRLLAIHDRAMIAEDIRTNYDIGVGQKFYLLFYISDHINIPRSYIVMQVEQFDDHGYLFNEPFFVSFEPDVNISDVPVRGLRIGVNGQEASTGQAYANVDTTINQAAVDAQEGRQVLSNIGTIIGVDQGATTDNFFLTFDLLGTSEYVRIEATPTPQLPTPSTEQQSDIGIKTFDEINETLSTLTGISKVNANVVSTFNGVRQQLPVDEDIQGFVAAQQLGVTQLAVAYCNELTSQEAQRDAGGNNTGGYYPDFDFGNNVASAFDATGRNQIIAPLLDSLLANSVNTTDQPTFAEAQTELDGLITTLVDNCNGEASCSQNSARVSSMVTAVCASAFGSGMMLIQ